MSPFFLKKCTSLFSFCTQESAVHWRTARQCAREQQVVEVEQSTFWTGTNAGWGWAETRLGQTTRHQCGIFYLKKKGKETQLNQCTNVAMFETWESSVNPYIWPSKKSLAHKEQRALTLFFDLHVITSYYFWAASSSITQFTFLTCLQHQIQVYSGVE